MYFHPYTLRNKSGIKNTGIYEVVGTILTVQYALAYSISYGMALLFFFLPLFYFHRAIKEKEERKKKKRGIAPSE